MEKAKVNGVEWEYEVKGSGEPVLLIGTGPIADSFLPFFSETASVEHYRLIRYHQRGQAGSTHSPLPVSYVEHAADAAALLGHLGVRRAHVAGHSTGAVIAMQLAADQPELAQTLALLEPTLVGAPGAAGFLPSTSAVLEAVGPALAAYGSGEREGAMAAFLSVVSGLDWETCRTVIEKHVPGGVAQAMQDADNWFASYLPALGEWQFGREQAGAIAQPVLSVLGTESGPLFEEAHALLHFWFPQVEDCTIAGAGHLLHLQRPAPVAQGVAAFFARHPITGRRTRNAAAVEAPRRLQNA
jgi:pimeloyl-ACP methyl ester carboxylesterase